MSSKKFVYSFLFLFGATMLSALYFFMKNVTPARYEDPTLYAVDWTTVFGDSQIKFNGQMQFEIRCESCHGPKGNGGLMAPSFTDQVWIHGSTYDEVYRVICDGVSGTEMTGWGGKLQKTDFVALTVYVKSLEKH